MHVTLLKRTEQCSISAAGVLLGGVLAALTFTGCKPVGPNYQRPQMMAPVAYKEAVPPPNVSGGGWKSASDNDAAPRGAWWRIFDDPQLNALEEQVDRENLQLQSAESLYQAATERIRIARAAYMPQLSGSITSQHESLSNNLANVPKKSSYNDVALNFQANWEIDFWGRIRRNVESFSAATQATAADTATLKLSLEAELATAYLGMRGLESQVKLLDATIELLTKQVDLTQRRFKGGLASELDVDQAQSQLDVTRAQAVDFGQARAAYVNAIAILTAQQPAQFQLSVDPLQEGALPTVPAGVPSELLERRPDIAAAERRVAQANAQVGIAIAAFYPTITIGTGTPGAGFDSASASTLMQGPAALWSLGGKATELLFDGGQRRASTAAARDNLDSAASNYRQTVLSSFAEVEDDLASLRVLAEESRLQQKAVSESGRALDLSRTRYERGMTGYLEVIVAENTFLSNQSKAATLITRRYGATVDLLRALGGGWSRSQIP